MNKAGQHFTMRYPVLFFLTSFFCLLFSFQSFAGSAVIIDSDKQFEFAKHYFSHKEYFRAIGEYKQFIYFFPEDDRVEEALFKIGMSYFYSAHFTDAIKTFSTVIDRFSTKALSLSDLSTRAYLTTSESHLMLKQPDLSLASLYNLVEITDDKNVCDEVYYRTGWVHIETANWERARLFFGKISRANRPKYRLDKLLAELDRKKLIKKKNPCLAGSLSILPGTGQLYCGRHYDALIAFLLNTALICAAYESFDDGNSALGGVISFVEIGFYAGNIYGAVAGAHKYNRNNTARFIGKLKDNFKIGLISCNENNGIRISLLLNFK